MDLDFSFTLRTSIKPTVEKKLKTKPVSGQNKRVLSSTRQKRWQGLFVNNEIDLQRTEKFRHDKTSPAKQQGANIFSVEVKENLDPSYFAMNTDENNEKLLNLTKSKSSMINKSEQVNTSSISNHDSSGEKDFIELGKVSLRKHQRTLYKRNIKDGKLFYKKNVIANLTEFIEKSFASNNCSDKRTLSDEVLENGLRVSEVCQVDNSALNIDENEDENDLFSGSISSTSSRLEKQTKKSQNKSVLDKSPGKSGNGLDQSLIVASPSLLSSSLLGCRPLSNGKKRPRDILDDSSSWTASSPKKRSFNNGESVYFENLKTKVKSIMYSSSSLCEDLPSLSPKPKSPDDSFIDCISASDCDEHDCSRSKSLGLACKPEDSVSSTNEKRKSYRNFSENLTGNVINGNGRHFSNTATRRKSLRNRCIENGNESTNGVEHKNVDNVASRSINRSNNNIKSKFETKDINGCDRLKENNFHDKEMNNSSCIRKNFDISRVEQHISTRSSRRKSSKNVFDTTECSNNPRTVNESCTSSVDIFDDSRLSEIRSSTVSNPVSDNIEDKSESRDSRMCGGRRSMKKIYDRGGDNNVGISLESSNGSVSNRVRGKKYSNIRISLESSNVSASDRTGATKYVDCVNSSGDLLGFCSITSKVSERIPSEEILEKSCDSLLKKHAKENKTELVNDPFTKPKTPRRKSSRLSGVNNLCKDESWVSRDMFESDIEDERPKSRLNSSREVDTDNVEIVIRSSDPHTDEVHFSISESVKVRKDRTSLSPGKSYADKSPWKNSKKVDCGKTCTDRKSLSPVKNYPDKVDTDKVHYNISESVKTRKDRKSLTPVKSSTDKPPRKSREEVDCDPGYVTPSLPRSKLLEITKWLTDSEKSIRHVPSTKHMPPPVLEEPIEEIVISDSCSEEADKLKTPPKAKSDKHRVNATDKKKTRNRTKTEKRSKNVKEEPSDKDKPSSRVKTISGSESKGIDTDNDSKQRSATANIGMYTEPKKPKKKKMELVQPSFTEKKPTKTSMFSSSSSSEDLFEKFLEDEKKRRLSRLKKLERFEKLSSERFIYDGSSEEENNSIAFYNDFIGSEVKKDVECVSEGKWSNHSAESTRNRHGHPRRLSFESQESGSDRAAINNALKTRKPAGKPKKRTPDKISKRHLPFRISPKHFLGSNKKKSTNKTNSVKKTHEDKVIEQIKRINDNKKLEPTTPSTLRSSTRNVPKTPLTSQKPPGDLANPSSAKLRKELFSKTPAKTLSFLTSLSVLDDGDRCHPDAVPYKNNFKKLKEELAKKLFVLYNREVFKNRLPEDLPIEWNSRMRSTSGYCFNKRTIRGGEITRSARIQLSSKILDSPDRLRDTLIHEMCHAATWLLDGVKDAHGPNWKNWTLEAMRRFPELPRIKVCHDYKIKTKYSYKCLGCGYSVGRHSKSLDTEHKRCGYCYGKFELLVNVRETADKTVTNKKKSDKESDTATSTSTTRALRAPTGFALFVKDNYAKIKQENGNIVHKDVMKLLSEKFAQVKLTKAIKEDEVISLES